MNHILLVEDDEEICEILQFYILKDAQYTITIVHTAEQALSLIKMRPFDLALVDIMLPGMDGIDFCARLRAHSWCPVIFISCINDDETIIRALKMGGDDYLIKPFQAPVLMARIDANLRRARMLHREIPGMQSRDLTINPDTRSVTKKGLPLSLSPTEYELLYYLMSHPDQFISFDELYQAVWQRPSLGDVRALFVHISHLRQKIEDDPSEPRYIRTHMRGGYIFSAS